MQSHVAVKGGYVLELPVAEVALDGLGFRGRRGGLAAWVRDRRRRRRGRHFPLGTRRSRRRLRRRTLLGL